MNDLSGLLNAQRLPNVVVALPSGGRAEIKRYLRNERRTGFVVPRSGNCWAPNKPGVASGQTTTWPEFVLVRLLEEAGWQARWIKNWGGGREYCVDVGRAEPIPYDALATFERIDRRAASRTGGGAWDVFAWKAPEYLFLESKQSRSSDRLRPGQLAWLEAGLAERQPIEAFAVVEYDAGRAVRI